MRETTFGKTGLRVSALGYGAAEVGYLQVDREQVAKVLNFMLDSGVEVIDTAAAYEGSEELIGETIANRRSEYVLISKCGQSVPGISAPAWSADLIRQTVDRSLRRLRTDRLDAMLLHSCDLETLRKGEALGALVDAQKAGKIAWVGYSGDNEAAAWAAARPEIALVEVSINIADQANIDAVLPVARQNKVGVIAKRPLANAAWKRPEHQPGFYGSYASAYRERLGRMKLSLVELGFTSTAEQIWPEIALRFTLAQSGVHTAIVGTTSTDNARANIAAANKSPLPPSVVELIRQSFRDAEAASGETWPGQT